MFRGTFAACTELLIGGEWRQGSDGRIEVLDPATDEQVAEVADGTASDAVAACDSC
jgi:acyl-CoA reductase-like NAD-dependent aldehyde dehydrogenase